ncbi:MAG: hypothetical protein ACMZ63_09100 [Methylotenera sp.]
MKSTLLVALACSIFTMNVSANEQDNGRWFPNESLSNTVVDASANQVALNDSVKTDSVFDEVVGYVVADNAINNATRLKFTSRRAALNPTVKNQDNYLANDKWVGATYVDEQTTEAGKRLNRQFRSKRSYINYQFD